MRFAPIRPALLALLLGSVAIAAAAAENAAVPPIREVSREQAPGISLRILELPIDAAAARRDNYFSNREMLAAFQRVHLTPGWPASHGTYWIGQGLAPYWIAGAVVPNRSVYFAAKVAAGPANALALSGDKTQSHLQICEVRFNPAAFPRGATLATTTLLQIIVVRDGCSLKGLGDQALQAEMRAPIDHRGYKVAEQREFPRGRRVTVVEYSGRERLSWPRAAAFVLGDARLALVSQLPAGDKAVGLVRQANGTNTLVLHGGVFSEGVGDRSVCIFQGYPWPQKPLAEYSRTWPLPESDDPAVAYCLAARKRSDDRYLEWLREEAKRNPIRIVPVPN